MNSDAASPEKNLEKTPERSPEKLTTRSRLIQSALELFAEHGVTATTTRQIAEQAEVNEVTLFRQFGNKEGLLLAVIEESPVWSNLETFLHNELGSTANWLEGILNYASVTLNLLEQVPHLLRSLVGEAAAYAPASREALGRRLSLANQALAMYLQPRLPQPMRSTPLSATALASLLNELLLGYVLVQATSEFNQLWPSREAFLASLTALFAGQTQGEPLPSGFVAALGLPEFASPVQDLPASLVQKILQQAGKSHLQDLALAYVLFGAGLTADEIVGLQRHQQISAAEQHTLVVLGAHGQRQVPLNQWIAGRRYGSYTSNPLTKWLRSRKDNAMAMFVTAEGQPLTPEALQQRWQVWTAGLANPLEMNPTLQLAQARQTWCVEMLMRGISLENLSLFTGLSPEQLQPYSQRAKEKAALEQATQLDRRSGA
jgi:AcrR family transcriptional regulator